MAIENHPFMVDAPMITSVYDKWTGRRLLPIAMFDDIEAYIWRFPKIEGFLK